MNAPASLVSVKIIRFALQYELSSAIDRSHRHMTVGPFSGRSDSCRSVCTRFYRAPRRASTAHAVLHKMIKSSVNDQFST